MGLRSYYNEIDPFAAAWLRNLIKEKLIPDGDVDERSIADVQPVDLKDYTQCHFFAGIGGWSYALQLAEWPDDEPVWTGSCPCQPFSVAGKGKGTDDERHLWPAFFRLIGECRPPIVIGEQVASRAGREWLSGVFADLESVGYAGAGADLCAAGVGAPHIRQRLYWVSNIRGRNYFVSKDRGLADGAGWNAVAGGGGCVVADAEGLGRRGRAHVEDEGRREQPFADPRARGGDVEYTSRNRGNGSLRGDQREALRETMGSGCGDGDMADTDSELRDGRWNIGARGRDEYPDCSRSGNMADANDERSQRIWPDDNASGWQGQDLRPIGLCDGAGFWFDCEWRRGADGKERRVKSGVRLLVDGVPNRVGRLRGYGNAIVPQVAAAFIRACLCTFDLTRK